MYAYPPSKEILRYGPLQERTHYYCEGVAFTKAVGGSYAAAQGGKVNRVPCTFEVAYTHGCEVIAICYFGIGSLTRPKRKRPLSHINFAADCFRLLGREIRYGLNVCVENLRLISHTHSSHSFSTYDVSEDRLEYFAQFFKVNLPKHRVLKAVEAEAAIDENSQDYETHFDVTGCEFIRLDRSIYFPLSDTDEDCFLTLKPIRKHDQREHDNEATGTLIVPKKCVPQGWNTSQIVDVWCALTSLAMGRDIQWVSSYLPLKFEPYSQEIIWHYRKVYGGRAFHAHIAGRSDFSVAAKFIKDCFASIMKGNLPSVEARAYVTLFRQFVYYQLMGVKDAEGIARLITTLTEEFLFTWERNTASKPIELVTRGERRKLDRVIMEYLRSSEFIESLDLELRKSADISLAASSLDLEKIIEKVIRIFRDNMRTTFQERLEVFFGEGEIPVIADLEWRIKAFIATRNCVAHTGRLLHFAEGDEYKRKVQRLYAELGKTFEDEYRNALVILPLMMLVVFGYQGQYREPNGWI